MKINRSLHEPQVFKSIINKMKIELTQEMIDHTLRTQQEFSNDLFDVYETNTFPFKYNAAVMDIITTVSGTKLLSNSEVAYIQERLITIVQDGLPDDVAREFEFIVAMFQELVRSLDEIAYIRDI
jgi:hypothetical protein